MLTPDQPTTTEIRISPDQKVAQRTPFDREDGRNWFCWIFLDERVDAVLLTDAEVEGWEIVWPREDR